LTTATANSKQQQEQEELFYFTNSITYSKFLHVEVLQQYFYYITKWINACSCRLYARVGVAFSLVYKNGKWTSLTVITYTLAHLVDHHGEFIPVSTTYCICTNGTA
jgi:hypothetical protein